VFTPYWKKLSPLIDTSAPLPAPEALPDHGLTSLEIDELGLLPRIPWDSGFRAYFHPGEDGAHEALDVFIGDAMVGYAAARDVPSRRGTSRLSPHLHFGELTPRQACYRLLSEGRANARAIAEPYLRELGWRDFAHHLMYHFPHLQTEPMQPAFAKFPWAAVDADKLQAWQRGRTGVPIVDAGMRELWQTGWMHNRVRMIVASFLTKNLRYHWREGANWFWDTLVDADLANNIQGWQWTAGCGADAAPYFRVFNPVSQGERFDPDGAYVKRFVPELAHLPPAAVHQPWTVSVRGYPAPIVDLRATREAALAAFAEMRAGA
jgi:deoxyribodipyrimidine photo-lyase